MKELLSAYYPITVVYTTVFLTLGTVLLFGKVPRLERLQNYLSGKRYFTASFLFLGIFGVIELLTAPLTRMSGTHYTYNDIFGMAAVSMIHAWLNGYAYLLMLSPAPRTRHRVLWFGRAGLPVIILAILLPTFLAPATSQHFVWLVDLIYTAEVVWIFMLCRREYDINVKAMDNYYDEPERLGWMNGVIICTLVLAFFNLLQYHVLPVGIPLRIANTLFYIYFFIRILDYIPTFLSIEEVTPLDAEEKGRTTNAKSGETQKKQYYYPDNIPTVVAKWTEKKQFCRENLTITDVAGQMNTNRNYLSAYLNHSLGLTYSQWLNTLRVEYAEELFRENPGKNISEVGNLVGIPEVYNFSRRFKQVTGKSPQKWLKTL